MSNVILGSGNAVNKTTSLWPCKVYNLMGRINGQEITTAVIIIANIYNKQLALEDSDAGGPHTKL